MVQTRPVPLPGPDEVLLRVSHCGVCGTDLHLVMDGWGRPDSIGGHEYSGEVAAVGARVHDLAPGDRVIGGPEPGCGECAFCRAHRPSLCSALAELGTGSFQGAFAEYTRVRADQVLRIPDALSLREAALAEPLAVALHGITRSGIAPGQRALVTGAGPIGACTTAALRARGVRDVAVTDPSPARRTLAQQLGATALAPDALELPKLATRLVAQPFDCVFECSGRGEALESGLAQLARTGTLVILGTGMDRPRLDSIRILLHELCVTGAYNYDECGFDEALALLARPDFPTSLLIEDEDVSLDSLLGAMQALSAGQIAGKVLVAPNAAHGPRAAQDGEERP